MGSSECTHPIYRWDYGVLYNAGYLNTRGNSNCIFSGHVDYGYLAIFSTSFPEYIFVIRWSSQLYVVLRCIKKHKEAFQVNKWEWRSHYIYFILIHKSCFVQIISTRHTRAYTITLSASSCFVCVVKWNWNGFKRYFKTFSMQWIFLCAFVENDKFSFSKMKLFGKHLNTF